MRIKFSVPGQPRPAGSKRTFAARNKAGVYTGKVGIMDASGQKGRDWREAVAAAGAEAYRMTADAEYPLLWRGPLRVRMVFCFHRPKSHYRTGRFAATLNRHAPREMTKTPDALKLARAVEDALSGVIYADDSQIVAEEIEKHWEDLPRALIEIETI